mmetsp:Transcript_31642/g.48085  ORF Transcript_31642/g.48085 Transcript_31642/m.48085 type:complete len:129 (-) Transcript_31642:26-412(-)
MRTNCQDISQLNLNSLAQLNLSGQRSRKRIQGPLPSFSSNPNLTGVSIGGNNLEGPIPPDFLKDVDHNMDIKIDLSFNMLAGAVPLTLDAFTKLDINLVGNDIDELDYTLCDNDELLNYLKYFITRRT